MKTRACPRVGQWDARGPNGRNLGLVLGGLLVGAAWGAIFGFSAQYAMRGRRDFSSDRALVAERYDVMVTADADRARTLITQLH